MSYMQKKLSLLNGRKYYKFFKRAIDVIGGAVLLVIFSPFYFTTAIAIVLDSKGPVFADVPERIGEQGKKFKMYKLRSMVVNAHQLLRTDPKMQKLYDEYKRGSYKLKKDPRITKVGKFIRRHSIDEIPQIINVLKGE